ncbi:MAG: RcnB family protein [Allopontixanthobacter sp.]|nr:RcnB family protein [Allopontixanthobacter sp.]
MTSVPSAAAPADRSQRAEQRENRGSAMREQRAARNEARREARREIRSETQREERSANRQQARPVQQRNVTRDVSRTVERDRRGDRGNRPTVANGQVNNRGGEAIRRQREQAPVVRTESDRRGDWTQNRDRRTSTDRNRSYTDRNRNESYDGRNRDGYRGDRDNYRQDRDGYRGDRNHRDWDRHSWRKNNRYNWYGYRASNRNLYRLGHYYAPYRNYRYSRLNIGIRLGSVFFGSRYWINDPWQYRLPEVYGPYRWVRYYDDVLLVNTYTGEVVDVIYDFFW